MGYAEHSHNNYGQGGSSALSTPFYSLRIYAEDNSPASSEIFEQGQTGIYGRFEYVWFLAPLSKVPLISYHRTNTRDKVLCNKTFNPDYCPACDAYEQYVQMYGKEAKDKPLRFTEQALITPVLVPRRQNGQHIYKGKSEVIPIYWFTLPVTDYIPEFEAQFTRLRTWDTKVPIHTAPYMIFKKDVPRGEKHEYWFKPMINPQTGTVDPQLAPQVAINLQHPLMSYLRFDGQRMTNNIDAPMCDLLENLALLQFKAYVDPATSQQFDYGGFYNQGLQAWNLVKDQWPAPAKQLPQQQQPLANQYQAPSLLPPQQLAVPQQQMMPPMQQQPVYEQQLVAPVPGWQQNPQPVHTNAPLQGNSVPMGGMVQPPMQTQQYAPTQPPYYNQLPQQQTTQVQQPQYQAPPVPQQFITEGDVAPF